MKKNRWVIIILIVVLIFGIGAYFGYNYYLDYKVKSCYNMIDSCVEDFQNGKNVVCPLCCDKYGNEIEIDDENSYTCALRPECKQAMKKCLNISNQLCPSVLSDGTCLIM